jgi:hypothetical protein
VTSGFEVRLIDLGELPERTEDDMVSHQCRQE